LAEAEEMAESMVSSLQKGGASSGGGSEAFCLPVFIFCDLRN